MPTNDATQAVAKPRPAPEMPIQAATLEELPACVNESELLVSVVITAHNYGRFLPDAIDSALSQERVGEVIVVDDASTDDTPDILVRYGTRIKRFRVEFRSVAKARQFGLRRSSRPLICFLDADNCLSPGYLKAAAELCRNSRVGIVACDLQCFGDASHLVKLTSHSFDRASELKFRDHLLVSRSMDRKRS